MPPVGCSFTEKLPLEIRRAVYAHVFHSEVDIKPARWEISRLHVALFATSKSIKEESREVFSEINTIILGLDDNLLTFIDLHGDLVRYLRIGEAAVESSGVAKKQVRTAEKLDKALNTLDENVEYLPELKRVTLDITGIRRSQRHSTPCTEPSEETLQCVDIGRYVHTVADCQIEFRYEYRLLAELWTTLVQEKGLFSSWDDYQKGQGEFTGEWRERLAERVAAHKLEGAPEKVNLRDFQRDALFLAVLFHHDYVERRLAAVEHEEGLRILKETIAQDAPYRRSYRRISKKGLMDKSVEFAHRVRLQDVRVGDGSDVLEWATELLASIMWDSDQVEHFREHDFRLRSSSAVAGFAEFMQAAALSGVI